MRPDPLRPLRLLAPLLCTLGPTLWGGQGTLGSWVEAEIVLADPAGAHSGAIGRQDEKASGREYITVGGPTTDFVSYVLTVPADMSAAVLSVRYSCSGYYTYFRLGKLLRVWGIPGT